MITNVNGTSPNMFWLDFFLVYTSPSQNPTGSSSGGVAATTATSSNGSGSKTISVKTAGAIIGGVAGGLVLVIALLVAYIVRLKHRHKRSASTSPPILRFSLCARHSSPTQDSSSRSTHRRRTEPRQRCLRGGRVPAHPSCPPLPRPSLRLQQDRPPRPGPRSGPWSRSPLVERTWRTVPAHLRRTGPPRTRTTEMETTRSAAIIRVRASSLVRRIKADSGQTAHRKKR